MSSYRKPNSVYHTIPAKQVIADWTTICLAPRLLSESSGSSLDCSRDTTLHRSKDFVVAPLCCHRVHPVTNNQLIEVNGAFIFHSSVFTLK